MESWKHACCVPSQGQNQRMRATGGQCEVSQSRQALSSPSLEVNKQSQRATLEWEKASDWGSDLETFKVPSSPESLGLLARVRPPAAGILEAFSLVLQVPRPPSVPPGGLSRPTQHLPRTHGPAPYASPSGTPVHLLQAKQGH